MKYLIFPFLLITTNCYAIGSYYYNSPSNGTFETADKACKQFGIVRGTETSLIGNTCTAGTSTATISFSSRTCPKGVSGTYPAKVFFRSNSVTTSLKESQVESQTTYLLSKTPSTICHSQCTYVLPSVTYNADTSGNINDFNYIYEANGTVCSTDNTNQIPTNVTIQSGATGETGGTGGTGGTISLSEEDRRILNNIVVKQTDTQNTIKEESTSIGKTIKDNIESLGNWFADLITGLRTDINNNHRESMDSNTTEPGEENPNQNECDSFQFLCDWLGSADQIEDEPFGSSEVPTHTLEEKTFNKDIFSSSAQCPSDKTLNMNFLGRNFSKSFSYTELCSNLEILGTIILILSYLFGAYIIVSRS